MALNFRPYPAPQQRDRGRDIGAAADSLSRALLYLLQGQQANKRLALQQEDRKRRITREDLAFERAGQEAKARAARETRSAALFPFQKRAARARALGAEAALLEPFPETDEEAFLRKMREAQVKRYLNLSPEQIQEFGPDLLPGAQMSAEALGGEIFQPTRTVKPGRFGQAVNKYKQLAQSVDPIEMLLGSRVGQYVPEPAQNLLRGVTLNPAAALADYLPDFKSRQVPTGVPMFRKATAEPRAIDRPTIIPRPTEGRPLTRELASEFLKTAKGNRSLAETLAREAGYSF